MFQEELKPTTRSFMVQTEEKLDESNVPEEPIPLQPVKEPEYCDKNLETGSNGSLQDEPSVD